MESEFTELFTIDSIMGKYLSEAFTGIKADAGPRSFQEFMGRAVDKRIFLSGYADPLEFLKSLEGGESLSASGPPATSNLTRLPLVYYYRVPGIQVGEDKWGRIQAICLNDTGKSDISIMPAVLQYQVYVLSDNRPALDKIMLALYKHRIVCTGATYKVTANSVPYSDLPVRILNPADVEFVDATPALIDYRVFGVSMEMQVYAVVFFAESVDALEQIRVSFTLTGFCGRDFCYEC